MKTKFNSVLIIGMGLIGSSIARALTENHVVNNIYGLDSDDKVIKKCKELNQWEFLLSIQPLKFEGGTGSPVNSIAIF